MGGRELRREGLGEINIGRERIREGGREDKAVQGEWYLEIKIWGLDALITTKLSLFLSLLSGQN